MTTNNEDTNMVIIGEQKELPSYTTTSAEGLIIVEEDTFGEEIEDPTDYISLEKEINILQDLFNEKEVDFGLEDLASLLMLDEEHFTVLSEPFLLEFESNIKQSKEMFSFLAKQNNYQLENFQQAFAEIQADINNSNELSQSKKDFILRIIGIMFDAFFEEFSFNKIISIPCELLNNTKLPIYAHTTDAGLDIYAREEITINPGDTKIINTGIKMAIPVGYAMLIQPRSGQSVKTKLRIANTPGLIDSGYRDEIGVIIENIEPPFKDIDYDFDDNGEIHIKSILHGQPYTITKGQKFAQMRLVEVPIAALFQVDNVGEIGEDRGGGFGSTDIG